MLDDTDSNVPVLSAAAPLDERHRRLACQGNARIVDMFQKGGLDIRRRDPLGSSTSPLGRPVTASFTTTSPSSARDGSRVRRGRLDYQWSPSPGQLGRGYVARNTIWGTRGCTGRPAVVRGRPRRADRASTWRSCTSTSNKQLRRRAGNTYREPVGLHACSTTTAADWVDVPGQTQEPGRRRRPTTTRVDVPGGDGAAHGASW